MRKKRQLVKTLMYKVGYIWHSDAEGAPCKSGMSDTEQRLCRVACLGHL